MITKPAVVNAWADGAVAPVDIVQPSAGFIEAGWLMSATPPARQYWNWVLNFCANGIRYFSQRGIVDYDPLETYSIGAIVRGDDGVVTQSMTNGNQANTPSTSPLEWGPVSWYSRTAQEIANGVVPTNLAVLPGQFERYGAAGDNVTDDHIAVLAAFASGHTVTGINGVTYFCGTGTLNIPASGIRAVLYGVKLRTQVNAQAFLNFTGSFLEIRGLEYYGRGGTVYAGNENGFQWSGTGSNSAPPVYVTGLRLIDVYGHDFGSRTFFSAYGQQALINEGCVFKNVGYACGHVLSGLNWDVCPQLLDLNNPPGASANAYGWSFTRDPTISDNLAFIPYSKNCKAHNITVRNNTLWTALDTHGGVECVFSDNIIENCAFGVTIGPCPGISGLLKFAPKNCKSIGNTAFGCAAAGVSGYGISISGAGSVVGTPVDLATGCMSIGDTISNYGFRGVSADGGAYFLYTQGLVVADLMANQCLYNAICMYHDNYNFVVNGGCVTDPYDNVGTDCAGLRLDAGYNTGLVNGLALLRVNPALGTTVAARGIYIVTLTASSIIIGPNVNTFTVPYSGIPNFALANLVDSTGAIEGNNLIASPGTYDAPTLDGQLAALAGKVIGIMAALKNLGVMQ
jgi:hypothetical protein